MAIDEILKDIASKLSKEFGSKVAIEASSIARKFLPTGNPLVDWVFGKGLPVGRIVEIFGEEGTGKSTLAYQILAETYNRGGIPILFDAEESFDRERGLQLGLEKVIIEVPEYVEQAFDMLAVTMEKMKEKDVFGVVVWDSLAATPPKSLLDGKEEIGAKARVVSTHLQRILKQLEESNLSLIILNQVRSMIDVFKFGGPNLEAPSARALRHEAVIRAQLRKVAVIKSGDKITVGIVSELMTVKNKITSPYRVVKLCLLFKKGFSVSHSILENAIDLEVVKVSGGWCEFEGVKFRKNELHKLDGEVFNKIMQKTLEELDERYDRVYKKIGL